MTERIRTNLLLCLVVLAVTLPAAAIAEEAVKRELKIAIDDGTTDGEIFINLADANKVTIDDMQIGESRSIVDKSGRSILVTRTADGLEVNVDGRVIELPAFDEVDLTVAPDGESVAVEKKMVFVSKTGPMDDPGVTIISDHEIDDATRDGIRSLLSSAGHEGEVRFIDRSALHDADGEASAAIRHQHISVLPKEREATN